VTASIQVAIRRKKGTSGTGRRRFGICCRRTIWSFSGDPNLAFRIGVGKRLAVFRESRPAVCRLLRQRLSVGDLSDKAYLNGDAVNLPSTFFRVMASKIGTNRRVAVIVFVNVPCRTTRTQSQIAGSWGPPFTSAGLTRNFRKTRVSGRTAVGTQPFKE